MAARATKSTATPAASVTPIKAPTAATPADTSTATPVFDLNALVETVQVVDAMPTASSLTGTRNSSNPFIPLIKASLAEGKARMVGPVPFLPAPAPRDTDDANQMPEPIVNQAAMTRITNLIRNGAKALGINAEIRKVAVEHGINVYFTGIAKDAAAKS